MRLSQEFRNHLIGQAIRWGAYWKVFPFEWDDKRKRVKAVKSTWHIFCSYVWLIQVLSVPPALFLRLLLRWGKMSPSLQMINATAALCTISFTEHFLFIILKQNQLVQTINTFFDYADYFEATFSRHKTSTSVDLAAELWLLTAIETTKYAFIGANIMAWVFFSSTPDLLFFTDLSFLWDLLGIVMIQVQGVPIDGFFLTLAMCFLTATSMFLSSYCWLTMLILVAQTEETLKQMGLPAMSQHEAWTRDVLRYPRSFCKVSRHLQILIDLLLEATMPILFVLPMNMVVGMVLWAYHTISGGDRIIMRSVCGLFFIDVAILFGLIHRLPGKISERFKDNVKKFSRQKQAPWITKTVKAIRPPKFVVYGLFTVSNQLTVEGYKVVLDNLISLLAI